MSHPEKKSYPLQKQLLHDIEHKLSIDLGQFLLLIEEGKPEEIDHAQKMARGDLLKYGPEMQKLAQTLGAEYPNVVFQFLDSVDNLVHCPINFVDEVKINLCYKTMRTLERML